MSSDPVVGEEDFGTSTGDPSVTGKEYLDALQKDDEAALFRLAEMHPDHSHYFMRIRSKYFLDTAGPSENVD